MGSGSLRSLREMCKVTVIRGAEQHGPLRVTISKLSATSFRDNGEHTAMVQNTLLSRTNKRLLATMMTIEGEVNGTIETVQKAQIIHCFVYKLGTEAEKYF